MDATLLKGELNKMKCYRSYLGCLYLLQSWRQRCWKGRDLSGCLDRAGFGKKPLWSTGFSEGRLEQEAAGVSFMMFVRGKEHAKRHLWMHYGGTRM